MILQFITSVLDPMTQCEYSNPPLMSFEQSVIRNQWERVDVCNGTAEVAKLSLSKYNDQHGVWNARITLIGNIKDAAA